MNAKHLQDLIDGYLDHALSEEQKSELERALVSSEEARRVFWEHVQIHAQLRDLLLTAGSASGANMNEHPVSKTVLRPVTWMRWLPLAAAASLAIVVGGRWVYQGRMGAAVEMGAAAVEMRVAEVRGKCSVFSVQYSEVQSPESGVRSHPVAKGGNTQDSTLRQAQGMNASNIQRSSGEQGQCELRVGDVLRPGDGVEVGADGFVKLAYADGSRVELERNTRLRVTRGEGEHRDAKRLALDAGKLLCEAARQRKAFEIRTPHATARLVGTRFGLEVSSLKTDLAVFEGKMRFERDNQAILVGPGQNAEASDQGLKMLPPAATRVIVGKLIRKVALPEDAIWSSGIAFDGSVLWVCKSVETSDGDRQKIVSTLFKLDPKTGKLLSTVDVSACVKRACGLDWDGVNLWIADQLGRKVVAVNPATGRPVKTLDLPNEFQFLHGVAIGGGHLWVSGYTMVGSAADGNANEKWSVLKLDMSSGAKVASWPVPDEVKKSQSLRGFVYLNGALWTVGGEMRELVYKLKPEDGAVLGAFKATEGGSLHALAQGGSAGQMWMVGMPWWVYLVEVVEN